MKSASHVQKFLTKHVAISTTSLPVFTKDESGTNLVMVPIPGTGSCLFQAILKGLYVIDMMPFSGKEDVEQFRERIAEWLAEYPEYHNEIKKEIKANIETKFPKLGTFSQLVGNKIKEFRQELEKAASDTNQQESVQNKIETYLNTQAVNDYLAGVGFTTQYGGPAEIKAIAARLGLCIIVHFTDELGKQSPDFPNDVYGTASSSMDNVIHLVYTEDPGHFNLLVREDRASKAGVGSDYKQEALINFLLNILSEAKPFSLESEEVTFTPLSFGRKTEKKKQPAEFRTRVHESKKEKETEGQRSKSLSPAMYRRPELEKEEIKTKREEVHTTPTVSHYVRISEDKMAQLPFGQKIKLLHQMAELVVRYNIPAPLITLAHFQMDTITASVKFDTSQLNRTFREHDYKPAKLLEMFGALFKEISESKTGKATPLPHKNFLMLLSALCHPLPQQKSDYNMQTVQGLVRILADVEKMGKLSKSQVITQEKFLALPANEQIAHIKRLDFAPSPEMPLDSIGLEKLVGVQPVLETIENSQHQVLTSGTSVLVTIEGNSGSGKSAVLQKSAGEWKRKGHNLEEEIKTNSVLLDFAKPQQEGGVPGWLETLYLQTLSSGETSPYPSFRDLLLSGAAPGQKWYEAVQTKLNAILADTALGLFLDNLHMADELTLVLLKVVLNMEPPFNNLFIQVTCTEDRAEFSPLLRQILDRQASTARHLRLTPMTSDAIRTVVKETFHFKAEAFEQPESGPVTFCNWLFKETGGHRRTVFNILHEIVNFGKKEAPVIELRDLPLPQNPYFELDEFGNCTLHPDVIIKTFSPIALWTHPDPVLLKSFTEFITVEKGALPVLFIAAQFDRPFTEADLAKIMANEWLGLGNMPVEKILDEAVKRRLLTRFLQEGKTWYQPAHSWLKPRCESANPANRDRLEIALAIHLGNSPYITNEEELAIALHYCNCAPDTTVDIFKTIDPKRIVQSFEGLIGHMEKALAFVTQQRADKHRFRILSFILRLLPMMRQEIENNKTALMTTYEPKLIRSYKWELDYTLQYLDVAFKLGKTKEGLEKGEEFLEFLKAVEKDIFKIDSLHLITFTRAKAFNLMSLLYNAAGRPADAIEQATQVHSVLKVIGGNDYLLETAGIIKNFISARLKGTPVYEFLHKMAPGVFKEFDEIHETITRLLKEFITAPLSESEKFSQELKEEIRQEIATLSKEIPDLAKDPKLREIVLIKTLLSYVPSPKTSLKSVVETMALWAVCNKLRILSFINYVDLAVMSGKGVEGFMNAYAMIANLAVKEQFISEELFYPLAGFTYMHAAVFKESTNDKRFFALTEFALIYGQNPDIAGVATAVLFGLAGALFEDISKKSFPDTTRRAFGLTKIGTTGLSALTGILHGFYMAYLLEPAEAVAELPDIIRHIRSTPYSTYQDSAVFYYSFPARLLYTREELRELPAPMDDAALTKELDEKIKTWLEENKQDIKKLRAFIQEALPVEFTGAESLQEIKELLGKRSQEDRLILLNHFRGLPDPMGDGLAMQIATAAHLEDNETALGYARLYSEKIHKAKEKTMVDGLATFYTVVAKFQNNIKITKNDWKDFETLNKLSSKNFGTMFLLLQAMTGTKTTETLKLFSAAIRAAQEQGPSVLEALAHKLLALYLASLAGKAEFAMLGWFAAMEMNEALRLYDRLSCRPVTAALQLKYHDLLELRQQVELDLEKEKKELSTLKEPGRAIQKLMQVARQYTGAVKTIWVTRHQNEWKVSHAHPKLADVPFALLHYASDNKDYFLSGSAMEFIKIDSAYFSKNADSFICLFQTHEGYLYVEFKDKYEEAGPVIEELKQVTVINILLNTFRNRISSLTGEQEKALEALKEKGQNLIRELLSPEFETTFRTFTTQTLLFENADLEMLGKFLQPDTLGALAKARTDKPTLIKQHQSVGLLSVAITNFNDLCYSHSAEELLTIFDCYEDVNQTVKRSKDIHKLTVYAGNYQMGWLNFQPGFSGDLVKLGLHIQKRFSDYNFKAMTLNVSALSENIKRINDFIRSKFPSLEGLPEVLNRHLALGGIEVSKKASYQITLGEEWDPILAICKAQVALSESGGLLETENHDAYNSRIRDYKKALLEYQTSFSLSHVKFPGLKDIKLVILFKAAVTAGPATQIMTYTQGLHLIGDTMVHLRNLRDKTTESRLYVPEDMAQFVTEKDLTLDKAETGVEIRQKPSELPSPGGSPHISEISKTSSFLLTTETSSTESVSPEWKEFFAILGSICTVPALGTRLDPAIIRGALEELKSFTEKKFKGTEIRTVAKALMLLLKTEEELFKKLKPEEKTAKSKELLPIKFLISQFQKKIDEIEKKYLKIKEAPLKETEFHLIKAAAYLRLALWIAMKYPEHPIPFSEFFAKLSLHYFRDAQHFSLLGKISKQLSALFNKPVSALQAKDMDTLRATGQQLLQTLEKATFGRKEIADKLDDVILDIQKLCLDLPVTRTCIIQLPEAINEKDGVRVVLDTISGRVQYVGEMVTENTLIPIRFFASFGKTGKIRLIVRPEDRHADDDYFSPANTQLFTIPKAIAGILIEHPDFGALILYLESDTEGDLPQSDIFRDVNKQQIFLEQLTPLLQSLCVMEKTEHALIQLHTLVQKELEITSATLAKILPQPSVKALFEQEKATLHQTSAFFLVAQIQTGLLGQLFPSHPHIILKWIEHIENKLIKQLETYGVFLVRSIMNGPLVGLVNASQVKTLYQKEDQAVLLLAAAMKIKDILDETNKSIVNPKDALSFTIGANAGALWIGTPHDRHQAFGPVLSETETIVLSQTESGGLLVSKSLQTLLSENSRYGELFRFEEYTTGMVSLRDVSKGFDGVIQDILKLVTPLPQLTEPAIRPHAKRRLLRMAPASEGEFPKRHGLSGRTSSTYSSEYSSETSSQLEGALDIRDWLPKHMKKALDRTLLPVALRKLYDDPRLRMPEYTAVFRTLLFIIKKFEENDLIEMWIKQVLPYMPLNWQTTLIKTLLEGTKIGQPDENEAYLAYFHRIIAPALMALANTQRFSDILQTTLKATALPQLEVEFLQKSLRALTIMQINMDPASATGQEVAIRPVGLTTISANSAFEAITHYLAANNLRLFYNDKPVKHLTREYFAEHMRAMIGKVEKREITELMTAIIGGKDPQAVERWHMEFLKSQEPVHEGHLKIMAAIYEVGEEKATYAIRFEMQLLNFFQFSRSTDEVPLEYIPVTSISLSSQKPAYPVFLAVIPLPEHPQCFQIEALPLISHAHITPDLYLPAKHREQLQEFEEKLLSFKTIDKKNLAEFKEIMDTLLKNPDAIHPVYGKQLISLLFNSLLKLISRSDIIKSRLEGLSIVTSGQIERIFHILTETQKKGSSLEQGFEFEALKITMTILETLKTAGMSFLSTLLKLPVAPDTRLAVTMELIDLGYTSLAQQMLAGIPIHKWADYKDINKQWFFHHVIASMDMSLILGCITEAMHHTGGHALRYLLSQKDSTGTTALHKLMDLSDQRPVLMLLENIKKQPYLGTFINLLQKADAKGNLPLFVAIKTLVFVTRYDVRLESMPSQKDAIANSKRVIDQLLILIEEEAVLGAFGTIDPLTLLADLEDMRKTSEEMDRLKTEFKTFLPDFLRDPLAYILDVRQKKEKCPVSADHLIRLLARALKWKVDEDFENISPDFKKLPLKDQARLIVRFSATQEKEVSAFSDICAFFLLSSATVKEFDERAKVLIDLMKELWQQKQFHYARILHAVFGRIPVEKVLRTRTEIRKLYEADGKPIEENLNTARVYKEFIPNEKSDGVPFWSMHKATLENIKETFIAANREEQEELNTRIMTREITTITNLMRMPKFGDAPILKKLTAGFLQSMEEAIRNAINTYKGQMDDSGQPVEDLLYFLAKKLTSAK